jgi:predicted PurR-regulated permease PerM
MFPDDKPFTLDRIVRLAITAGLIWGLIWLLSYLSDVLIPFAVALLLAYMINPLVLFIKKTIRNHTASVFIALLIVLASLTLLGFLIIPPVVNEIAHMGRLMSDMVNNTDLAERAAERLPPDLWQTMKEYAAREDVQAFFSADNFWKLVETVINRVLPGVWGLIAGTASFILGILGLAVILLYLVFLLIDYNKVGPGWKNLLPQAYKDSIINFVEEFDSAMNSYFRARATVAFIIGILSAFGFWLINLPMGILLGLFIGVLNMVPYLQVIGFVPAFMLAFIYTLETGQSFWVILGLTASVFAVVQVIEDTVLVPRFMGKVTGLSPAVILLSLSIWGKLLGFFGLLIGLPLTCLILAYYRRFLAISGGSGSETSPGPDG